MTLIRKYMRVDVAGWGEGCENHRHGDQRFKWDEEGLDMRVNIPTRMIPLMKCMCGPKVDSMSQIDVNEKKTRTYHTHPTSSKVALYTLLACHQQHPHVRMWWDFMSSPSYPSSTTSCSFPFQTHSVLKYIHHLKVWHSTLIRGFSWSIRTWTA